MSASLAKDAYDTVIETIEPAYRPKPEFGSYQSTVQCVNKENNNVKEIASPKININVEN